MTDDFEEEYAFQVEYDGGEVNVASNDGDGQWCRDADDVRIFMLRKVQEWYEDLADVIGGGV